jgi:hypothetical protein
MSRCRSARASRGRPCIQLLRPRRWTPQRGQRSAGSRKEPAETRCHSPLKGRWSRTPGLCIHRSRRGPPAGRECGCPVDRARRSTRNSARFAVADGVAVAQTKGERACFPVRGRSMTITTSICFSVSQRPLRCRVPTPSRCSSQWLARPVARLAKQNEPRIGTRARTPTRKGVSPRRADGLLSDRRAGSRWRIRAQTRTR